MDSTQLRREAKVDGRFTSRLGRMLLTSRTEAVLGTALLVALNLSLPLSAQDRNASRINIRRAAGSISIDGDLSDSGWAGVTKIDTWYETNPGDNLPAKLRNVGYLTFDDRFFYAAFEFDDPDIRKLRAPYADRDNVPGSTDYGGVILNSSNDRKTAVLLLANPRGIQYDALTNDTTGEDSSPDYYWDAATRITATGWTLEMRVPFSSLRYSSGNPQEWGILLYRNYPRDRRYQMFNTRLPRGVNCFICNSSTLTGLEGLPSSGHIIAAPYVTSRQESSARNGLGNSLTTDPVGFDGGLDAKWIPNAETAIDVTVNPDFSQVESDVAVISTNERFAIFFPEKRPFFLEGIDIFSTPIQAVYTRSITSPRLGGRSTGTLGKTAYTLLLVDDRGGGSVILPGPNGSGFANQDFKSANLIGRARRDLGRSFASFLVAARQISGGGYNRLLGPDFEWRPTAQDSITGQVLFSQSETPVRPELTSQWNGQKLSSYGSKVIWSHSTHTVDWYLQYDDVGDDFRADLGFVPQVGYRENFGVAGYTFRPKGFLSRVRAFVITDYASSSDGALIFRQISPGVGMDGKFGSFMRFRVAEDKVRSGNQTFDRRQFHYTIQASPSRTFSAISLSGWVGEDIDFANSRPADGLSVSLNATIRPTDHLELKFTNSLRYLDVAPGKSRLFTAQVERLNTVYTFNARSFLRLIGEHVRTDRDPSLYGFPIRRRGGSFNASALYAYKLNWQTVLFVGLGDNLALTEAADFEESDRQLFLKVSYALQR